MNLHGEEFLNTFLSNVNMTKKLSVSAMESSRAISREIWISYVSVALTYLHRNIFYDEDTKILDTVSTRLVAQNETIFS
jgi:hypothetical protein